MNVHEFLKAGFRAKEVREIEPDHYQIEMYEDVAHRYTKRVPELENLNLRYEHAYATWMSENNLYVDLLVHIDGDVYLITGSCNLYGKRMKFSSYVLGENGRFERHQSPILQEKARETISHIQDYFETITTFRLPIITGQIEVKYETS